jgi:hypothetical protein
LPAFAGPTSSVSGIRPIVDRAPAVSRREAEIEPEKRGESGLCGLRPAAASCGRLSRHLSGALVAEISLLRSPACVRKGQAKCRTFSLANFSPAVVTHEDCFARHVPPFPDPNPGEQKSIAVALRKTIRNSL